MARSNTGDTANWFSNATPPVTAMPLTMACWVNAVNVTAYNNLVTINSNAGTYHYWSMALGGDRAGDPITAETNDNSGGESYGESTAGYTAGAWHHACAVFLSSTSRCAYLNGANKGTNTTSQATTGVTRIQLGAYDDGATKYSPLNGSIAEVGIWNVALSDAEVLMLGKGFAPPLVRPDALVAYWPLYGRMPTTEQDRWGNCHMTINGTMAFAAHVPNIKYPSWVQVGFPIPAAPVGGNRRRRVLMGAV